MVLCAQTDRTKRRQGHNQVRAAAMQQAMDSGAYAPLGELLAAPFRATVIRELP